MLQKDNQFLAKLCFIALFDLGPNSKKDTQSLLAGIPKSVVDTRPNFIWRGFGASSASARCKTDVKAKPWQMLACKHKGQKPTTKAGKKQGKKSLWEAIH